MNKKTTNSRTTESIPKTLSGIQGLDEITHGGLPTGRPTLICGSAGCGKTLLAMEFLMRGATQYGEPGVFMAFEENEQDLILNMRSLGFDLKKLIAQKKILLDYIHIDRQEIEETGEYDLEGLFIRLDYAIKSIGAKRVVLDTIEALFAGLPNEMILRAELRRLFRWLKDRGMTAIITGESGDKTLTRHGLEEYVADCVMTLDHRVQNQMSTRRLRVVKYRGTVHGTNEYPFLIGEAGISVLPVTSLGLNHEASVQRISSGIPKLDEMLAGKGYYRGSSVLVSGSPGVGKSSIAAHFIDAACRRGERCQLFAYEESSDQIMRNMRSIGIDLAPWIEKGLLQIHAVRPTLCGIESHLVSMHHKIGAFKPSVVVVDPISSLSITQDEAELKPTLMRLIDFLKMQKITALFTSLVSGGMNLEDSQVGVSSLMDTWLLLRNAETNGERNRTFYVLKSRGTAHSNQIREFVITNKGVDLQEIYLGADKTLTGSARATQEANEALAEQRLQREHQRRLQQLDRKRTTIAAQIIALEAEMKSDEEEMKSFAMQEELRQKTLSNERRTMSRLRGQ
ncbi:MAG TPA: KaiC 1 [Verrucomicrobia bacterium]|nr:MAG: KaiC 1 [Lentisphaerae bacterium GWF2_57_35]HBA84416.1 KaiC 1 [Verrucomicrobiota bacterium]